MKIAAGLLLALSVNAAAAATCYSDERTDEYTCYDHVTEKDGIRYADHYTGGPRAIRATGYQFAANCRTGVIHIKDRYGVTFGGGKREDTPASISMFDGICRTALPKPTKPPKGPATGSTVGGSS